MGDIFTKCSNECPECPPQSYCPPQSQCPECPECSECSECPPCSSFENNNGNGNGNGNISSSDNNGDIPKQSEEQINNTTNTTNTINTNNMSFKDKILNLHNQSRKDAGIPSLEWDDALTKYAKEWNQYLKNNNECEIRHPTHSLQEKNKYIPNNIGQNLYSGFGYDEGTHSNRAISAWYNECEIYKPPEGTEEIPPNFKKIGHFTQMQWKDASKVGCDKIECTKRNTPGVIITCNYDKGNIGGQFNNQVVYNTCPLKFT